MAKERVHELKQTANSFQLRGIVSGMKSQKAYRSGVTQNGGNWNAIEFGVKIAENKSVFVKLNGFPRSEVFYYKKGENGAKGTTQKVAWKDRHKSPGADYRLIGVNISTDKDENGKNLNRTFTEYDAVEWIHDNLKDGDSVFIKGTMEFSSYTDRNGQTRKKVDFVPTQISYTQKPVDFNADDYTEMAEFENMLVFKSIDKEEGEDGKPTGRYTLTGYSVGYNNIENVSFVIDADHAKLAGNLKKAMKSCYAIKTFGRVEITNDISVVEGNNDGWGEASPMERVNTPTKREYVIYRADPNSIEREDYSEESISAAMRKINAAKTAAKNFGEKAKANIDIAVDDDDDWINGGFDSDDTPW